METYKRLNLGGMTVTPLFPLPSSRTGAALFWYSAAGGGGGGAVGGRGGGRRRRGGCAREGPQDGSSTSVGLSNHGTPPTACADDVALWESQVTSSDVCPSPAD